MHLEAHPKPISDIFPVETKVIYKVPVYQRNYSWKPSNIEDLFNDISNENSGYYIGNILITPSVIEDPPIRFDVVDGQQRLTTIALFFLALYERMENLYPHPNDAGEEVSPKEQLSGQEQLSAIEKRKIPTLQERIKEKLLMNNDMRTPRLKLQEKDAEIFENYLGILEGREKGRFGNRVFGKRYRFIYELIESLPTFSELEDFYSKLNDITMLKILVTNITDAFSVFSSLNATGVPLTLIDLLKSHYLAKAISANIETNDAQSKWTELINIFNDDNGDPNSFAITQFLLNNYDTFIGTSNSSITKNSALREYEAVFSSQGHNYIDTLIKHAKIFSTVSPLVIRDNSIEYEDELNESLDKLMKLESSQAYPLMLFLLKRKQENHIQSSTVAAVFNYLIKYYVRRNFTLKPKSSNIRARIIETIRKLSEESNLNDTALIVTKEKLNPIMSSKTELMEALNGALYDSAASTIRFVFIDLEREKGSYFNAQTFDTLDDYITKNRPRWSLEHILPQNPNLRNDWSEMISPDNIDEAEQIQQKHMHRIGNLTLTGYNSEMSDKSFVVKRDYKLSSDPDEPYTGLRTPLFLNNSIVVEGENIDTKDKWTVEDIGRRTTILSDLIMERYNIE
ncbi:MAG: DUF262 domain-containing HNH endonuclease family protein [Desemzia incerta]|uniref:DUF262 domain-containing protein n=1 Tax=Desemzia incerta TaxID=82801 RepID=UPI003314B0A0